MDTAKSKMNAAMNALNSASITRIIVIFLILFITVGITFYIRIKLSLRKKECKKISSIYKNFPTISSFNKGDTNYQYNLKDYYIKTAYNACSIGNFKNSFVDLCSLKEVIRQGYRCLDMAIYSVENEPVVATSSVDSYDVKQTYNSIPFDTVCETIANYAFSNSSCPNPNDPLLIHMRVLSQNSVIYKKMADIIYNRLNNHVLGKKYSYEYEGNNIGDVKIGDLQRKVVIMIDKSNKMYEGTDLDEYVNIASNSVFMQALRYDKVRYAPDMQEQIEYNKKQMTIVLPNLGESDDNPSAALTFKYGCQMIALSAQNYDENLKYYDEFFNQSGSAFVLKPEKLRYIPTTATMPDNPPKSQSYASRTISSDFYKFNM